MFEVSEEFFPFCVPRLLRKIAHPVTSEAAHRLMAARNSGVDHGLVCLPILDLPAWVLAAEIKVMFSLNTRDRRERGSCV